MDLLLERLVLLLASIRKFRQQMHFIEEIKFFVIDSHWSFANFTKVKLRDQFIHCKELLLAIIGSPA